MEQAGALTLIKQALGKCYTFLTALFPGASGVSASTTYTGMFDAMYKITKYEGIRGLYKVLLGLFFTP
jgi:hypothetical protein